MVNWGLMGPASVASSRRTRTLGLGACVRYFNDVAVPGLGGITFGKQLLWALLGIDAAEKANVQRIRVRAVEAANAIEAMACLIALKDTKFSQAWRIRGKSKLANKDFVSFAKARRPSFYTSQPMRMGTVQPLMALGLVTERTGRFNSFTLSAVGQQFLHLACAPKGYASVQSTLGKWIAGERDNITDCTGLEECLHPEKPLPDAAQRMLRSLLEQNAERKAVLTWLADIDTGTLPLDWDQRPAAITEGHWKALHAGSRLFATRNAALALLDDMERQVNAVKELKLPLASVHAEDLLPALHHAAQSFLDTGYDNKDATDFCRACVQADATKVMRHLLALDTRVLCLQGEHVVPGLAFRTSMGSTAPSARENPDMEDEEDEDSDFSARNAQGEQEESDVFEQLPDISRRIYRMRRLYKDLQLSSKNQGPDQGKSQDTGQNKGQSKGQSTKRTRA